jgi:DHA1 family tetracycline resistance protein-like MFS transporter
MQFICAPILEALSDRRRPVLLLALAGLGFDYVLLCLAPNLWWLVAGRIVAGIGGCDDYAGGRLHRRRESA